MTIRRATARDAEAIARLAGDLGYASTVEAMRTRIDAVCTSSADLLMVAIDAAGGTVGWLHAHAAHSIESGLRVEILGLIVGSKARRAGVGRTLVAEAEQWATSLGAGAIVVRSNVIRLESHAFYPALGYTETKTQRVYRKALSPSRTA